jgi:hypothetical protein
VKTRDSKLVLVAALGAAALVIAAAGVFLLVLPQRTKATHLNSEIATAQSTLADAHRPAADVPVVQATDLFRLREAMPDDYEMPGILIDLGKIAKASSVTVASIHPGTEVALSGYWALPIVLTVNGKFAGVTSFLARLRQGVQTPHGRLVVNGRLLVANQVQLVSSDGRSVVATLNLDAFQYGAPLVTTTTTTPGTTTTGGTTSTTTTTTAATTTTTTATTTSG